MMTKHRQSLPIIIALIAGIAMGCEDPNEMEVLEYWEKAEGIEEMTLMDEIDYRGTLNVFCLLDPESETQSLLAEHLTLALDPPELKWEDSHNEVYLDEDINILLQHGADEFLFKRNAYASNVVYPAWDLYSLTDSTININYGDTYTLEIADTLIFPYQVFEPDSIILYGNGNTIVPGPFEIISPAESSFVENPSELTFSWSPSSGAQGYVIFIGSAETDTVSESNRYEAATIETSHTFPYFAVNNPGWYSAEIWAVDKNYLYYYLAEPYNRLSPNLSGMPGASGIFASRVIRRVNFLIKDAE